MLVRELAVAAGALFFVSLGQLAIAQEEPTCADIQWSSMVTDNYPNIADACDAVIEKDGKMFARVEVEIQRVRGRVLTFKILNNDGSSGGSYTQTVSTDWRAKIGGRSYRPNELYRGQQLNVYVPQDRWAVISADDDAPDIEEAVAIMEAPVLPKTASPLPLFGLLGAGFMALAAGLGVLRRRLS